MTSTPVDVICVPTFVDGVVSVLRYWRDVHTDARVWSEAWLLDAGETVNLDDVQLSNDYFSVDMEAFKIELAKIALENGSSFYCPECGYEGEESECEECEIECYSNAPEDFVECMDFSAVALGDMLKVMREYAFPIYSESVGPVFEGVLEEVNYYILKITQASDNFETLAAVIEALGLAHVHGEIFEDYLDYGMYGVKWRDILNMRENGITAHFDADEVKEYLAA